MDNVIGSMTTDDLSAQLVGRRIVHINPNRRTIKLDNGTKLWLQNTEECCAYFEAKINSIDLSQNAVTSVRREELPATDSSPSAEHYALTVLTVDKEICSIEIEGNLGTGEYFRSINLVIGK